jgi:hypothetical protein
MDKHKLRTTAQVEREYEVEAETIEQARDRLRQYFKDSAMLRDGIVQLVEESQTDVTPQRIVAINGEAPGKAFAAAAEPEPADTAPAPLGPPGPTGGKSRRRAAPEPEEAA